MKIIKRNIYNQSVDTFINAKGCFKYILKNFEITLFVFYKEKKRIVWKGYGTYTNINSYTFSQGINTKLAN